MIEAVNREGASGVPQEECEWKADEDGTYHTACGHLWFFDSAGATENQAKFCVYCGRRLRDVPYSDADASAVSEEMRDE